MRATELRTCCSHVRGGASPHHASARSRGRDGAAEAHDERREHRPLARAERRSPRVERAEHLEHHDGSVDPREGRGQQCARQRISAGYRPVAGPDIRSRSTWESTGRPTAGRRRRTDVNTNIIGHRAARALAVVLLASGAAIGLTACQTATGSGGAGTGRRDHSATVRSDADREVRRSTRRPRRRGDRSGDPGCAAAVAGLHQPPRR